MAANATTHTIEQLASAMTLAEKVSMLAGADFWTTVSVPRLSIPSIKVTDGPNGARGARSAEPNYALTSACFPAGIALAATWNVALIGRIGAALAEETRSKGAHMLLAPTVNIHRSPLNGRNFECYSEDPYLTSRIAVAYIKGLQENGVSACIKHFVCNDSEFQRHTISSEVTARALHEIYLPPFRAAVLEAGTWAVMSAYNRINGVYASENSYLLRDVLKGAWGFDGVVVSDWYGSYSDSVAAGGLDLEMPGPARHMGAQLLEMVANGTLDEALIDDKVLRLLRLFERTGALADSGQMAESADNRPHHRQLIRQAAGEAAVLLKNDDALLPLDEGTTRSIAVIGINATQPPIMGGGSAYVTPHYVITPLDGIRQRAGGGVSVPYEAGVPIQRRVPVIDGGWLGAGLDLAYFNTVNLDGDPVRWEKTWSTYHVWFGSHPDGIDPNGFSLRLSGTLTVPESGRYTFGVTTAGKCRLYLNGELILDLWQPYEPSSPFFDQGHTEITVERDFAAGQPVALMVEYSSEGATGGQAVRLGCTPSIGDEAIRRAVQLAEQCDSVVLFAGTNGEWESEGADRTTLALPGAQDALIEAVAAANQRTVVVLNTGSPVAMPWLDRVGAVVQAWFPGQESGNAIADVLFGDVNPSGKLTQTFPMRLEDNPAYINYPGENGRVHYGEGLFVGYRYYDMKRIEPLFPFGFGLSYTEFAYSHLRVVSAESPHQPPTVHADITNTGSRSGQEVVQLYVRDVASRLTRPEKELKGFAKVMLAPGETQTVTFALTEDALAYFDDLQNQWIVEPGTFELLVGASSRDIRLRGTFDWPVGGATTA